MSLAPSMPCIPFTLHPSHPVLCASCTCHTLHIISLAICIPHTTHLTSCTSHTLYLLYHLHPLHHSHHAPLTTPWTPCTLYTCPATQTPCISYPTSLTACITHNLCSPHTVRLTCYTICTLHLSPSQPTSLTLCTHLYTDRCLVAPFQISQFHLLIVL